jgi:hypothetical protein
MSSIWSPTITLRWQEIVPSPKDDPPVANSTYIWGGKSYVLQQRWINLDGKEKWENIPINMILNR